LKKKSVKIAAKKTALMKKDFVCRKISKTINFSLEQKSYNFLKLIPVQVSRIET